MASSRLSPLMMLLGAVFFLSANVFAAAAVLGVDLGTEYIKAALVKPGIPLDIVLTKDSRRKETSAVAFKPSKSGIQHAEYPERLYGADAMAVAPRFPGEVYPNLKTLLGLRVGDSVVQEYAARHPSLQLQAHPERDTATFKTSTLPAEEEAWMVEELLAMELQSMQKNAEVAAGDGTSVRSVVLTVPPFYTLEEKRAVQLAAELAGLKVLSLISDGLAVGLNYATSRQFPNINEGNKPEHHLVFDMGAGSSKATVMKFQSRTVKDIGKFNKTVQEIQVLGSGWDRTLGGDALNYLITDDMVNQFVQSKAAQKESVSADSVKAHGRAMAKLLKEAERLRHILSANQNTQASFEGLYEDIDFKYKLTRADFETMAETHVARVAAVIKDALKMANLETIDLDSVILHGGASRTPFVQKALEIAVGSADLLRSNVNSDEAAAFGAGFRAAELSASFRVKEIRISGGSSYPAGLQWTSSSGKAQKQRLWTPVSALGAAPKEVTFSEHNDFPIAFYQQVGEEERLVKTITTTNLTATVAALKDKYPSCNDEDIYFRVGAKLSSENGEVEIVKARVECEAEVTEKEGFVDGVKNLFGFGKKDQEPLAGDEAAAAQNEDAADPADSSSASTESPTTSAEAQPSESAGSSSEAASSGAEEKPPTKKKELVGIPVDFTSEKNGMKELSQTGLTKSKDRLKAFTSSDKARIQREEALNQLEGYTYNVRDMLDKDDFVAKSTEQERKELAEKANAASEWLYDDGADAPKDELKAKLKELQSIANPILSRVEEAEKRPELVANMKSVLNETNHFIASMRNQITEYEEYHASASAAASTSTATGDAASETPAGDFDGLEDDDASSNSGSKDDVVEEERGPAPPLYKVEDLDELEAVHKDTADWLKEMETKQEPLGDKEDPVLLVKDLKARREKLDKAGMDLAMKGVKNFDKKKKPKKPSTTDKKKSSSSSTASGEPAAHTINLEDQDTMLTQEQLDELLKNINLDDLKGEKAEEDAAAAAAANGEKVEEHVKDEL